MHGLYSIQRHRRTALHLVVMAMCGLFLSLSLSACQKEVAAPLLDARGCYYKMLAPMHLRSSMFYAAYPNGQPTDYVTYTFSTMGAAEAPLSEDIEGEEARQVEGMARLTIPIWPKGVVLKAIKPAPQEGGYQLVISGDNAKSVIVLEGYDFKSAPAKTHDLQASRVFRDEVPLPKVTPDEKARIFYQSYQEMGG